MVIRAPLRTVATRWLVVDGAERTLRSPLPVFTVTVTEFSADSGAAKAGAAGSSRAEKASRDTRR